MTVIPNRLLVLGCGPAGLLACHACRLHGWEVDIISPRKPSFISGAQFLHTAIPELTKDEPDGVVDIIKYGTKAIYADKIYGDPGAPTSWDTYPEGERGIWNLAHWYQELWDRYYHRIYDAKFYPNLLHQATEEYLGVFSTIPLKEIFPDGQYRSESVWIVQSSLTTERNRIVYNGTAGEPWYRASELWGHVSSEYPGSYDIAGTHESAIKILKPLYASIYNPFRNLYLLGRYGQWKKGVLVDDAFREAYELAGEL